MKKTERRFKAGEKVRINKNSKGLHNWSNYPKVLHDNPIFILTREEAKDLNSRGCIYPLDKAQDVGFLSLMNSLDRFEKMTGGWFKDKFLTKVYGKDFFWSSDSLEKHLNWKEAEEYAAKFGRQASDFELSTLIDRSKSNPAIIEAASVLNLKTDDWYWSNRQRAFSEGSAWFVSFFDGYVYSDNKANNHYVRPVRSSQ
jgi:hypothetical protein